MGVKNNVTRLLGSRGIPYKVFTFSEEKHSAEETPALLGVPEDHVYKTLVVLRDSKGRKPLLVLGA